MSETAVKEAVRFTLSSTFQAVKDRFTRRFARARAVNEGLDALNRLLKVVNLRTRHSSQIIEEITQLFFVTDQAFPDALDHALIRLLSGLTQWFSKQAFYRVALLAPVSGIDCEHDRYV